MRTRSAWYSYNTYSCSYHPHTAITFPVRRKMSMSLQLCAYSRDVHGNEWWQGRTMAPRTNREEYQSTSPNSHHDGAPRRYTQEGHCDIVFRSCACGFRTH
mmetsp:Transcript_8309/g.22511  ORF Transcript_8309/g.22511 Transcript_8309/m.22511 type:complete len:101 (+) Transcript_8309:91-393(+)